MDGSFHLRTVCSIFGLFLYPGSVSSARPTGRFRRYRCGRRCPHPYRWSGGLRTRGCSSDQWSCPCARRSISGSVWSPAVAIPTAEAITRTQANEMREVLLILAPAPAVPRSSGTPLRSARTPLRVWMNSKLKHRRSRIRLQTRASAARVGNRRHQCRCAGSIRSHPPPARCCC